MPDPVPVYGTLAAFKIWLENNGIVPPDDSTLNKQLCLAEEDIDGAIGFRARLVNGKKFGLPLGTNELKLTVDEISQLSRATYSQAEYRLQMGRDFFVEDQRDSIQSPDGVEQGKVGKIGPRARRELWESGLTRLTGRMR